MATLALVVIGIIFLLVPGGGLQGVGGIIFGTGLSVFLATLTNRQQLAKEANLRRKTEVYGPLHAELQNLRERLDATRAGTKPYLQQIAVPRQASLNQLEEAPQLHLWSEFKADYRSLDFSEATRQILNHVLQLTLDYNTAVEQALKTSEAAFVPCIKAAIAQVEQSSDFQQWDKDHPGAVTLNTSSSLPNDWFIRIQNARATTTPPLIETVWATMWLRTGASGHYRPTTLGWLVAGNPKQAVRIIYEVCRTPAGSYPPPPSEWLQDIMNAAWSTLEHDPTYLAVQTLHEELFKQVGLVETKLMDSLRSIQEIYEGGPPPL